MSNLLDIDGVTTDQALAHELRAKLWPQTGNIVDEGLVIKAHNIQRQQPHLLNDELDADIVCRVIEQLPLFPPSVNAILVRNEYDTLLELCVRYKEQKGSSSAYVVSGHPGIGACNLLKYLIKAHPLRR
jgi:hypothetical protein